MKSLEALKYLKENKRRHWLDNDNSNECLDTIEKELKALKILKEKVKISVYRSRHTKTGYEMCIEDIDGKSVYAIITEKIYELLKEVLE